MAYPYDDRQEVYPYNRVGVSASTPEQHAQAREVHRSIAQRCREMRYGVAHHKAADLHDVAANNCNDETSYNAREASRAAHRLCASDVNAIIS